MIINSFAKDLLKEIDLDIDAAMESLMTCNISLVPSIRSKIIQAERDKSIIIQMVKKYRKDND